MLKRFTEFAARLQGSVFALPVALGVAVLMVAISELAFGQARKELQTLTVLGQARLEVTHILRRVTDAETGQRGYLLTGSADYLAPFRDANREAAEGLERLNQQLKDAGESRLQTARQALQTTVEQRMSEMNVVLSLYESKRQRGAVEMVGSGIGREHMEQTRQRADALLNALNERIGEGLVRIFDTLLLGRVGVTLLSAVSLLAVLMFLQLGRQLARQREEQRASIALERDRLTHEVQQRTTELTELARHLVNVREDERARLARDLHDELGALLTTAKLDVARLRPRLSGESPEVSARLAPSDRGTEQRHRAETPHHRGPATLDAGQPGPAGGAGESVQRVGRAAGHPGACRAAGGAAGAERPADGVPLRAGGADQYRQVRPGQRGAGAPVAG